MLLTLRTWQAESGAYSRCCDISDARRTAMQLVIPYYNINSLPEFKEHVADDGKAVRFAWRMDSGTRDGAGGIDDRGATSGEGKCNGKKGKDEDEPPSERKAVFSVRIHPWNEWRADGGDNSLFHIGSTVRLISVASCSVTWKPSSRPSWPESSLQPV